LIEKKTVRNVQPHFYFSLRYCNGIVAPDAFLSGQNIYFAPAAIAFGAEINNRLMVDY